MHKKIICFDLDGVICKTKGNDYKNSKPIIKNIKIVNFLKKKGFVIKVFTARFMGRSKENVYLAKKRGFKLTLSQLKKWGLDYDFLIMRKPTYDLFIDDKNLSFDNNWSKELLKELKLIRKYNY